MNINPDDPWYPCSWRDDNEYPGVTIRLKLAAMISQGFSANPTTFNMPLDEQIILIYEMADAMIERANRESPDKPPEVKRANYTESNLTIAIALFDEWMADNSGYDEATWPVLKRGLMGWK